MNPAPEARLERLSPNDLVLMPADDIGVAAASTQAGPRLCRGPFAIWQAVKTQFWMPYSRRAKLSLLQPINRPRPGHDRGEERVLKVGWRMLHHLTKSSNQSPPPQVLPANHVASRYHARHRHAWRGSLIRHARWPELRREPGASLVLTIRDRLLLHHRMHDQRERERFRLSMFSTTVFTFQ